MTDKQIIMKEITECGFYCSKDDTERLYIYEVIKNTDEEWLKENPEATLLIDEWLYDYTDYDDRKVYGTSGNLIDVCYASTCEVYKIEDTKYKIYGNCGQFLIEDKPTYKEQLKRKEQECEEFKYLADHNGRVCNERLDKIDELEHDINELNGQLDQLKEELAISIQENEEGREINAELKDQNSCFKLLHESDKNLLKRKEQEYEELKKSVLKQCPNCGEEYLNPKGAELYNENVQLKKALTEIKEIAEKHAPRCAVSCPNDEYKCEICMLDDLKQILQKCEVLDEN